MKLTHIASIIAFTILTSAWSCGQNGPTQPQVRLTWVQGVPPIGDTVTLNNVYRCAGVNCIPGPPAIFTSTAPITSYIDQTVVRGTTYGYAVTATVSSIPAESGYSNVVSGTIPAQPGGIAPPTVNPPTESKAIKPYNGPSGLRIKIS